MILVTGSSGYLGKHVVRRLTEQGANAAATSSHWDLTKPEVVADLLRAIRPDLVIHCAAKVPKTGTDYNDGKAAGQSLAMVRNLAKLAPCPITFASSLTAEHPTTEYAYAKLQAERIITERGVDGDVVIRLPGLFGAPRRTGVLYNAARAFLSGEPFMVSETVSGWAAMDVRDAAECMVTGKYTGPTKPMDLQAVVALVRWYCGPDIRNQPEAGFAHRLTELVDWVREDMRVAA